MPFFSVLPLLLLLLLLRLRHIRPQKHRHSSRLLLSSHLPRFSPPVFRVLLQSSHLLDELIEIGIRTADRDPLRRRRQGMDPAVLDDIISRLVEVRTARPGKQVQLSESEIRQLCVASREIFLQQPNLLELEAPIKICGRISNFRSLKLRPLIRFELF
ncbi:hypothetical protein ACLOJK_012598 [Asimina triloba]